MIIMGMCPNCCHSSHRPFADVFVLTVSGFAPLWSLGLVRSCVGPEFTKLQSPPDSALSCHMALVLN